MSINTSRTRSCYKTEKKRPPRRCLMQSFRTEFRSKAKGQRYDKGPKKGFKLKTEPSKIIEPGRKPCQ